MVQGADGVCVGALIQGTGQGSQLCRQLRPRGLVCSRRSDTLASTCFGNRPHSLQDRAAGAGQNLQFGPASPAAGKRALRTLGSPARLAGEDPFRAHRVSGITSRFTGHA